MVGNDSIAWLPRSRPEKTLTISGRPEPRRGGTSDVGLRGLQTVDHFGEAALSGHWFLGLFDPC